MSREIKFSYSVINITTHPNSAKKYYDLFVNAIPEAMDVKNRYLDVDNISLEIEGIHTNNSHINSDYDPKRKLVVEYIFGTIVKCIGSKDRKKRIDRKMLDFGFDFDADLFCQNVSKFPFVFFPHGHRMFFVRKHKGKNISTARLVKTLKNLFNKYDYYDTYDDVEVNLETDISGIQAMLSIHRLDRLQISVSLPNGDDLEAEEEEWLNSMREQRIAKITEDLKGHKNRTILPDKRTRALMGLAQSNGEIIAHGLHEGENVVWKNSDFPVDFQDKYNPEYSILKKLIDNGIANLSLFTKRQRR